MHGGEDVARAAFRSHLGLGGASVPTRGCGSGFAPRGVVPREIGVVAEFSSVMSVIAPWMDGPILKN